MEIENLRRFRFYMLNLFSHEGKVSLIRCEQKATSMLRLEEKIVFVKVTLFADAKNSVDKLRYLRSSLRLLLELTQSKPVNSVTSGNSASLQKLKYRTETATPFAISKRSPISTSIWIRVKLVDLSASYLTLRSGNKSKILNFVDLLSRLVKVSRIFKLPKGMTLHHFHLAAILNLKIASFQQNFPLPSGNVPFKSAQKCPGDSLNLPAQSVWLLTSVCLCLLL